MRSINGITIFSSLSLSYELLEETLYLVHGSVLRGKEAKAKWGMSG